MKNFNLNMVLKKNIIDIRDIIVTTFNEWIDDKAFTMAAALSFYSIISLVPVIIIVTSVAGLIFGQKAATGQLITGVSDYVGLPAAELIQSIILNVYVPESRIFPIIIGLIFFIWTSLTVFVEIRSSLNSIWGIEVKPGKGITEFFKGRMFSILILVLVGLLFIFSLMAGILLNFADDILNNYFSDIKWLLAY